MTVYRSGVVADEHHVRRPAVSRHWRQVFPRRQLVDLVNVAFARVELLNSPPRGQPFIVRGEPYASDEEFIDDLCEELREQLRSYVGKEVQS